MQLLEAPSLLGFQPSCCSRSDSRVLTSLAVVCFSLISGRWCSICGGSVVERVQTDPGRTVGSDPGHGGTARLPVERGLLLWLWVEGLADAGTALPSLPHEVAFSIRKEEKRSQTKMHSPPFLRLCGCLDQHTRSLCGTRSRASPLA